MQYRGTPVSLSVDYGLYIKRFLIGCRLGGCEDDTDSKVNVSESVSVSHLSVVRRWSLSFISFFKGGLEVDTFWEMKRGVSVTNHGIFFTKFINCKLQLINFHTKIYPEKLMQNRKSRCRK